MEKHAVNNAEIITLESNQAILFREQKKYSKAYKCIEKVIKLGRNDGLVYSEAGLNLYELEKYEKALDNFEKAINLGKNESWIYYYSFWSASCLGYKEKAQEFIEKGLNLYPDDVDLNFSAGLYYESIKEYKKALTYLDKVDDDYEDKYSLYLSL